MPDKRSAPHLQLIVRGDLDATAPDRIIHEVPYVGAQLSLFPEHRPRLIAIVGLHYLQDGGLAEALHKVRPRIVIDVRFSPRFDLGMMNRRVAFELFREISAVYLDLFSMVSRDIDIESALLAESFRSRLAASTKAASGPIMFLADGMVPCSSLFRAVKRNVTTEAMGAWDFVLYPHQYGAEADCR